MKERETKGTEGKDKDKTQPVLDVEETENVGKKCMLLYPHRA